MKIVILDADTVGASPALDKIARLGEFVSYPRTAASQTAGRVADADIVITNKVVISREVMEEYTTLLKARKALAKQLGERVTGI